MAGPLVSGEQRFNFLSQFLITSTCFGDEGRTLRRICAQNAQK